jgi:hypothetical protein
MDLDELTKSLFHGHCEEQSDKAISRFQLVTVNEIAPPRLPSGGQVAMKTTGGFCESLNPGESAEGGSKDGSQQSKGDLGYSLLIGDTWLEHLRLTIEF